MHCNQRHAASPRSLPSRRTTSVRGITLVELLVSIGVLAMLVAVVLPALAAVRAAAQYASASDSASV